MFFYLLKPLLPPNSNLDWLQILPSWQNYNYKKWQKWYFFNFWLHLMFGFLFVLVFSFWNKRKVASIVWPSLYSLYYSGHFYVGYFPPHSHKVAIKKIFHFLLNQHTFYLLKSDNVWFLFKQRFFIPYNLLFSKTKTKHLAI